MTNIDNPRDLFIESIKRAANAQKKACGDHPHSHYLQRIAEHAGFKDWGQLKRKLETGHSLSDEWQVLCARIGRCVVRVAPSAAAAFVTRHIRAYLDANYERGQGQLTPGGVNADPRAGIDLQSVIREKFGQIYETELIDAALPALVRLGPWREIDDLMFDYDFSANMDDYFW